MPANRRRLARHGVRGSARRLGARISQLLPPSAVRAEDLRERTVLKRVRDPEWTANREAGSDAFLM